MRFTKEELSEKLRERLGKDLAMSERTLSAQTERLYRRLEKAGNDDEAEQVAEEYLPDFEEINNNVRNDTSRFVREWQKKHPEEKVRKTEAAEKSTETEPTADSRLDLLFKEVEALKAENARIAAENAAKAKKEEIRKSLRKKGVSNDKWLDAYLRKQSYTEETDAESEVKDILEFYNINNAIGGNANAGRGGGAGREPEVDFSDIAAIRKRQRGGAGGSVIQPK